MRWRLLVGSAAALLAVAAGLVLASGEDPTPRPPTVAPVAPVVPGDFESDPSSVGWTLDPGAGTVGLTRARARSGSSSLLVRSVADGPRSAATYSRVAATPGSTYAVGAYAYVASGRQHLGITFRDAAGRGLATATSPTGGTTRAWSRVSLVASAPPGTRSAQVSLVAASDTTSAVDWDDLSVVDTTLDNGGAEDVGTEEPCPRRWTCVDADGASAKSTTSSRHSGAAALLLDDASSDTRATALTPRVQVQPSVGHTVAAWAMVSSGEPTPSLSVHWYDASMGALGTTSPPVRATDRGRWEQVAVNLIAPDAAAWARVELATSEAGTGEVVWDDVSVAPAGGAGTRRYDASAVARLDGFTSTTTSRVVDVGGRPKLVTIVSGAPATLQVADLQTGLVEGSHPLPGLVHGWGLTLGDDLRSVYVGSGNGHLARYDLSTRQLTDLGRATPRATTVFGLATGADGRIWGASYPRGEVWTYDPSRGAFTSFAPLGGGHEYARSIAVDTDWVYVGTGSTAPGIVRISTKDPSRRETIALPRPFESGLVVSVDLHGRYLAVRLPEGQRAVYDTVGRTWDVPLALDASGQQIQQTPSTTGPGGGRYFYYLTNGRLWRVDPRLTGPAAKTPVAVLDPGTGRDRTVVRTRIGGVLSDWLLSFDGFGGVSAVDVAVLRPAPAGVLPRPVPRLFTIRLRPNPVPIKSLAIGSRGDVLVGGFGGSSLSILDPSEAHPRLRPLASDPSGGTVFGEVEGMVSNGRFDFFGSYTSARLFRGDSTRPWVDGENPRLVATLGPRLGQDRPIAWAVAGDRTVFGTIPQYGRLGGVLGWFDGAGTTPRTVWSPVPEQSIVALSASGSTVYGGTSRWGGLGVAPRASSAEVFAYDLETQRTLWHVAPLEGAQAFAAVLVDRENRLWAATQTTLFELDRDSGSVLRRIPLLAVVEPDAPTYRTVDLAAADGTIVVATRGALYTVDVQTLAVATIASRDVSPARVRALGDVLYFPSRATLMRAVPR